MLSATVGKSSMTKGYCKGLRTHSRRSERPKIMGVWRCKVSLRCGIRNNLRPLHLAASSPYSIAHPSHCRQPPLELAGARRIGSSMEKLPYQRTDYSVVVKNRASPPKLWRWEIYRAGNAHRIKQSSIYFDSVLGARRAGKEALQQLLDKLFA
jgi:hypothetical protein